MITNWKRTVFLIITALSVVVFLGYNFYPIFSDDTLVPDKRVIIFLETSGKGTLGFRQLASVESAARFIPNSDVKVFIFTDGKYLFNSHMAVLEKEYKVQFIRTSLTDYISNTPLVPWYKNGIWKKSPYVVAHTSDALRLLSLWKFGGIYLDLDVLVTRPWDVKDNTVIRESESLLGNAVLVFKKKHPVLLNCLTWLEDHYDPDVWIANGPALITDKLNEYLRTEDRLDNVTILPTSAFYEVNFTEVYKFFYTNFTEEVLKRIKPSFGVHLWNKVSAELNAPKNSSCAYNMILSQSSPIIYARMQNE